VCGRFNLRTNAGDLMDVFSLTPAEGFAVSRIEPRFNIAPTQPVLAVRQQSGTRQLSQLQWGLIPFWAKEPGIGSRMINARAETVSSKPSFRAAFRSRRCLILANGFYEWQKRDSGNKQPFHIQMTDGKPFAFAGLWEQWISNTGDTIESCCIITTTPNELMSGIHDRMPVILHDEHFDQWIDPAEQDVQVLQDLLGPYPADAMHAYRVATLVNNPRNETPDCLMSIESS